VKEAAARVIQHFSNSIETRVPERREHNACAITRPIDHVISVDVRVLEVFVVEASVASVVGVASGAVADVSLESAPASLPPSPFLDHLNAKLECAAVSAYYKEGVQS